MEHPQTYSHISFGIEISVIPRYNDEESNPSIGKFIFSYEVQIKNNRSNTIKLLNRHWNIYESILIQREVKGEGVIGQQPEIIPGEFFQYMSWCPLNSPMGKMVGQYEFEDMVTLEKFWVKIPEFKLTADYVFN